jgi:asparagine synthase (glutamine-hydrolysing)
MCGIFGFLSGRARLEPDCARTALELLAHRGPDGEGMWTSPGTSAPFVTFGHRRLAIIDLSPQAAQPMSDGRRLWITYNGELYNYLELMKVLESRGYRFRSHSDTEVILHAYEEWGEACLERFNGMFALAIWDADKRELFVARDRFGEKPFHYVWDPEHDVFAFASEIKALLALPVVDGALDDRALFRFVAFQELAASDQTLWRGVRRLPHAHWLRLAWRGDRFDLTIRRYWDIDLERIDPADPGRAARRFAELFEDSVRLRLRADVPVGSSLSGGLDSSAVVCQIHALGAAAGQKTFTARMHDPKLDEGSHVAKVLAHTGIQGHEVWPSAHELERLFPQMCRHLEEPFISTSQFAQHLVMRLARDHGVIVLLDGQGADEILAGYRLYYRVRYDDLARTRRLLTLGGEWLGFRTNHRRAFPLSARDVLYRVVHGDTSTLVSRPSGGIGASWDLDWLAAHVDERPRPSRPSKRDRLTQRLYTDALDGELQELLRYGDRNSMAWSRELRQPFLDHRLAELLFPLPIELKMSGAITKRVMRDGLRHLLPAAIRERKDKLGYEAPMRAWLERDLAAWVDARLEQATDVLGGRLDLGAVRAAWRPPLGEPDAQSTFLLLTLAECIKEMRAVALTPVGIA